MKDSSSPVVVRSTALAAQCFDGGCVDDGMRCKCECHNKTGGITVMHCFPCCEVAPCGQDRIPRSMMAAHQEICPKCQELAKKAAAKKK